MSWPKFLVSNPFHIPGTLSVLWRKTRKKGKPCGVLLLSNLSSNECPYNVVTLWGLYCALLLSVNNIFLNRGRQKSFISMAKVPIPILASWYISSGWGWEISEPWWLRWIPFWWLWTLRPLGCARWGYNPWCVEKYRLLQGEWCGRGSACTAGGNYKCRFDVWKHTV